MSIFLINISIFNFAFFFIFFVNYNFTFSTMEIKLLPVLLAMERQYQYDVLNNSKTKYVWLLVYLKPKLFCFLEKVSILFIFRIRATFTGDGSISVDFVLQQNKATMYCCLRSNDRKLCSSMWGQLKSSELYVSSSLLLCCKCVKMEYLLLL